MPPLPSTSSIARSPWTAKLLGVLGFVTPPLLLAVGAHYLVKYLDPARRDKAEARRRERALRSRLRREGRHLPPLDDYEAVIAGDIVNPEDIAVGFADVGGIEQEKAELYDVVVMPLRSPHLFARSRLLSPPKGILLYGPPGTGKTMLAKAIARECGAMFINLNLSTLLNKWFGESQKLIRAVFSLAHKLSPAIIFIDEIDSFLRARSSDDHAALASMKAEFMALWDGLLSDSAADSGTSNRFGVMVIGATNRPWDIDPAIQRRMARMFEIGLPDTRQREHILRLLLHDERLAPEVDLQQLARGTEGYSGSDLKELCRVAVTIPLREYMTAMREEGAGAGQPPPGGAAPYDELAVRDVAMRDFTAALPHVRPTEAAALQYLARTRSQRAAAARSAATAAAAVPGAARAAMPAAAGAASAASAASADDGVGMQRPMVDAAALHGTRAALLALLSEVSTAMAEHDQQQQLLPESDHWAAHIDRDSMEAAAARGMRAPSASDADDGEQRRPPFRPKDS